MESRFSHVPLKFSTPTLSHRYLSICSSPVCLAVLHLSVCLVLTCLSPCLQVKDKILDQVYRGAPFSQRPAADSLELGTHTHTCLTCLSFDWQLVLTCVSVFGDRVAFRSGGSPDPVRWWCHSSGSGSLETNQHAAALQGDSNPPITSVLTCTTVLLLLSLHFLTWFTSPQLNITLLFFRFQTEQQLPWFLVLRAQVELE